MYNQIRTDAYEAMLAETITISGFNGDRIRAYFARPLGEGPFPGVILIPHMPGWDEISREYARRFAHHGYATICPNIYERVGHGLPQEVAGMAREQGGVADDSVMGDVEGALEYLTTLPNSNGKVGVIGMCSGGRHAFLAGCRIEGLSAVVDCWGGRVVASAEELSPATPVAPIDLTSQLSAPLLGIFGNDDMFPSADQVDIHEAELKKYGKDYTFYRYDGAGHGFWYYTGEAYRPVAAMESFDITLEFFKQHLQD
ncbi:MAG: dienelactone hydrolase family protein [Coriobacteriia bacterium]|nr:dienelactone hydrolase family protein [Coriobacteriia bacterium]